MLGAFIDDRLLAMLQRHHALYDAAQGGRIPIRDRRAGSVREAVELCHDKHARHATDPARREHFRLCPEPRRPPHSDWFHGIPVCRLLLETIVRCLLFAPDLALTEGPCFLSLSQLLLDGALTMQTCDGLENQSQSV